MILLSFANVWLRVVSGADTLEDEAGLEVTEDWMRAPDVEDPAQRWLPDTVPTIISHKGVGQALTV